jgi:hypothetical protein
MFTRCYAFMYDRISRGSERAGLRDERAAFWRRHGATRSRSAPAPGSTSPLLGVGHEPFRYSWMGCHPNRATLDAITRSKLSVLAVHRGAVPKAPVIERPMVVGRAAPSAG